MLDLYDGEILGLQDGLTRRIFSSIDLTNAYLNRIAEVQDGLRAVICTNPQALKVAQELDEERRQDKLRGPLHGIPILVKDNICTRSEDGMDTTAGSRALVGATMQDAHVVQRLRQAGCVIIGKLSLSQFSWGRDWASLPCGWNSIVGQATSPFYKDGNPSGSSSGSGIAAAIGLAAGTVGTETSGSIIAPSSRNNVVGIRPTVGLISRTGIIPFSPEYDSAGPICRTVADAAILLGAMVGIDNNDKHTSHQPKNLTDYIASLRHGALNGARLGVPRQLFQKIFDEKADRTENDGPIWWMKPDFDRALAVLRSLGAEVIDVTIEHLEVLERSRDLKYRCELKSAMNNFLGGLKDCQVHNLSEIITFNKVTPEESQDTLIEAEETLGVEDPRYAVTNSDVQDAKEVLDSAMQKACIDAYVMPTCLFEAWSRAGYPQVVVPLGFAPEDIAPVQLQDHPAHQTLDVWPGRPFGLTFAGTAWSEAKLISYAYGFEQATHHRLRRRPYDGAMPKTQVVYRDAVQHDR
ncbi:MAG: hypothetical protein CYPHOPRED_003086 [Cyphobasidiales sp. Tagirdzhanova-0007]|nr:MAG: hypothetical protein CYPHOPRED_003086 [Cyphobasidiales sp. Tagirdzhanova-0007]